MASRAWTADAGAKNAITGDVRRQQRAAAVEFRRLGARAGVVFDRPEGRRMWQAMPADQMLRRSPRVQLARLKKVKGTLPMIAPYFFCDAKCFFSLRVTSPCIRRPAPSSLVTILSPWRVTNRDNQRERKSTADNVTH